MSKFTKEFLDNLIGMNINEEAVQMLDSRDIGPETIYTQDIQQDRLNIMYDKNDIIKSWYYG
jgi:hypothetical protein